MNVLKKRDYIHSHLHQIDESVVNEVFEKLYAIIENKDPILGYETSGNPITKSVLLTRLKKAKESIDAGDYITHEDLKKEAESW